MMSSAARSLQDFVRPVGVPAVEYADTDASGEPRLIGEKPLGAPALKILSAFDTTPALRRFIWRQNPHCIECGALTDSPDSASYVPHGEGFGVACLIPKPCAGRAIVRANPWFNGAEAVEREERVVRDLRLVSDDASEER